MDGCVRDGSWLNVSTPWESEVEELWPCHANIQPGSYFPGSGFAVFNTSGANVALCWCHFVNSHAPRSNMCTFNLYSDQIHLLNFELVLYSFPI